MSRERTLQLARWIAGFLACAHIFGIVMFWGTNQLPSLAVPVGLLLVVARPPSAGIALVTCALVFVGYLFGGIPFLDPELELDVRVMHLVELIAAATFIGIAFHATMKRIV